MVKINGQPTDSRGMSIAEYLAASRLDSRRVAAELNGTIVRAADFSSTYLRDGDVLELVVFVGGG